MAALSTDERETFIAEYFFYLMKHNGPYPGHPLTPASWWRPIGKVLKKKLNKPNPCEWPYVWIEKRNIKSDYVYSTLWHARTSCQRKLNYYNEGQSVPWASALFFTVVTFLQFQLTLFDLSPEPQWILFLKHVSLSCLQWMIRCRERRVSDSWNRFEPRADIRVQTLMLLA